jgi:hypothetical protein
MLLELFFIGLDLNQMVIFSTLLETTSESTVGTILKLEENILIKFYLV